MRLSTPLMQQLGINALLDQQSKLSKTQLQLASGKKNLTPADDPIAAARTLDLQEEIRKHRQYQDNIQTSSNRLSLEEATLSSATDILQRVRELAVQANNLGILRPEDKEYIAKEVRQALDELVGLANTKNANGEYLFAGTTSHTQPYPDSPNPADGYYKYQGDANYRLVQIGPSRRLADGDPGTAVFEGLESALAEPDETLDGTATTNEVQKIPVAAVTPGSVYELRFGNLKLSAGPMDSDPTLAELVTALQGDPDYAGAPFTVTEGSGTDAGKLILAWSGTGDVSGEASLSKQDNVFSFLDQFAQALEGKLPEAFIGDSLHALDSTLERIDTIRASVGSRLNAIDQQRQVNEGFTIEMQATLSQVQDLDYAAAISRFNLQQTALEAAQQSYARLQNLSLFNFLR